MLWLTLCGGGWGNRFLMMQHIGIGQFEAILSLIWTEVEGGSVWTVRN